MVAKKISQQDVESNPLKPREVLKIVKKPAAKSIANPLAVSPLNPISVTKEKNEAKIPAAFKTPAPGKAGVRGKRIQTAERARRELLKTHTK